MITLSLLIASLVAVAIVSDVLKGRKVSQQLQAIENECQSVVTVADHAITRLEDISNTLEAEHILANENNHIREKDDLDDFPDFSALLFNKPYLRLSIEMGHKVVAVKKDLLGNVSINNALEVPHIVLAEEFEKDLSSK